MSTLNINSKLSQSPKLKALLLTLWITTAAELMQACKSPSVDPENPTVPKIEQYIQNFDIQKWDFVPMYRIGNANSTDPIWLTLKDTTTINNFYKDGSWIISDNRHEEQITPWIKRKIFWWQEIPQEDIIKDNSLKFQDRVTANYQSVYDKYIKSDLKSQQLNYYNKYGRYPKNTIIIFNIDRKFSTSDYLWFAGGTYRNLNDGNIIVFNVFGTNGDFTKEDVTWIFSNILPHELGVHKFNPSTNWPIGSDDQWHDNKKIVLEWWNFNDKNGYISMFNLRAVWLQWWWTRIAPVTGEYAKVLKNYWIAPKDNQLVNLKVADWWLYTSDRIRTIADNATAWTKGARTFTLPDKSKVTTAIQSWARLAAVDNDNISVCGSEINTKSFWSQIIDRLKQNQLKQKKFSQKVMGALKREDYQNK